MSYVEQRQRSRLYRDGLARRTREVIDTLRGLDFSNGSLLDIGAADGAMLGAIAQAFPRAALLGVDAHRPYVDEAAARQVPVVLANANALPTRSDRFDVVTMVSTLKHISDYEAVLRECIRVLRPGGWLLLSDVSPHGIRLGELGGHFRKPPVVRRWSLANCIHELTQMGLEVEQARHYMPLPVITPIDDWLFDTLHSAGVPNLCMQQIIVAQKPPLIMSQAAE